MDASDAQGGRPVERPEVIEVVPGDYEVHVGGRSVRVLVPAGVGVPGVSDEELAGALVAELAERGVVPPRVIDVSTLLSADPGLLIAIADRCDAES